MLTTLTARRSRRLAALPRRRHAALRQPPDRRGRWLHRLARRGDRRAQARAVGARAGRRGLPGRAARACEAFGFDGPAIAAYRRPQGRHRPDRGGVLRQPSSSWTCSPSPAPMARHPLPGGWRRRCRSAAVRHSAAALIGTLGIGVPPAARLHRPHHARPGDAAAPVPPLRRRAAAGLRDRGFVGRHRRAPARRHADRAWRCSPTSRQDHLDYHGTMEAYWAGQGRAVPLARPARRGGQHRRREGRGAGAAIAAGVGALDVWTVSAASGRPA